MTTMFAKKGQNGRNGKMDRQINETYFDYLRRLTEMVHEGIISYEEFGDCLLGEDNTYSSDNLRKAYYVIKKLVPRIESDIEYTVDDDVKFKQYQLIQKESYKASVQLRDQRRELRKWNTSEARFEHLVDVMVESIAKLKPLPKYEYGSKRDLHDCNKTAILMLSDWHYGALVDTQYNFYDTDMCIERARRIFDKCLRYSTIHKVDKLFIELNGDMIHGLINVSNRVQSEEDVADQIMNVAHLISTLINDMKPYYKQITVVSTFGNHGRLTPEKTAAITKENFERLTNGFIKLRLDDDIKFIEAHSEDFLVYDCDGKIIYLAHGQYDKLNTAISDCVAMTKIVPDEIHLGHTHSFKDINKSNIMVTVGGSLMGSDDYALTLRKNTKPHQSMIIYDEDRCVYQLMVE